MANDCGMRHRDEHIPTPNPDPGGGPGSFVLFGIRVG